MEKRQRRKRRTHRPIEVSPFAPPGYSVWTNVTWRIVENITSHKPKTWFDKLLRATLIVSLIILACGILMYVIARVLDRVRPGWAA